MLGDRIQWGRRRRIVRLLGRASTGAAGTSAIADSRWAGRVAGYRRWSRSIQFQATVRAPADRQVDRLKDRYS